MLRMLRIRPKNPQHLAPTSIGFARNVEDLLRIISRKSLKNNDVRIREQKKHFYYENAFRFSKPKSISIIKLKKIAQILNIFLKPLLGKGYREHCEKSILNNPQHFSETQCW